MSDDPGNPSSFLGNPGEPVAEVDPDDLKILLAEEPPAAGQPS